MATQIPGEPVSVPFDTGVPDNPQGSDPYTPADDDNFTASTLESTQEIGAPENLLICDRSGFKIPVSAGLVKTWDNLMVRQASWEPRQPQGFVRGIPERQTGSPLPEQDDKFLATNDVSSSDL